MKKGECLSMLKLMKRHFTRTLYSKQFSVCKKVQEHDGCFPKEIVKRSMSVNLQMSSALFKFSDTVSIFSVTHKPEKRSTVTDFFQEQLCECSNA